MCANTKGLEVVVAKEVQAEAHMPFATLRLKQDCFPVVVREVFAQLPVDVVGRKRGLLSVRGSFELIVQWRGGVCSVCVRKAASLWSTR